MSTMTNHEVRSLTAEEIDTVTGAMNASFNYRGLSVDIYADAGGGLKVTASSGCHMYEIEHT
jgi:hypothetical protein